MLKTHWRKRPNPTKIKKQLLHACIENQYVLIYYKNVEKKIVSYLTNHSSLNVFETVESQRTLQHDASI